MRLRFRASSTALRIGLKRARVRWLQFPQCLSNSFFQPTLPTPLPSQNSRPQSAKIERGDNGVGCRLLEEFADVLISLLFSRSCQKVLWFQGSLSLSNLFSRS